MQLVAYLTFDGRCEEAFQFYARCLNAKIVATNRFAGTPAEKHVPADWRNKIMHMQLEKSGAILMGSDAMPGMTQDHKGFSVAIQLNDPAEAERIFQALAETGKVTMPIAKTFWAERFGALTDQFGVPWMINCDTGH